MFQTCCCIGSDGRQGPEFSIAPRKALDGVLGAPGFATEVPSFGRRFRVAGTPPHETVSTLSRRGADGVTVAARFDQLAHYGQAPAPCLFVYFALNEKVPEIVVAQQSVPVWKPAYVPLICLPSTFPTPVPVPVQSPANSTVQATLLSLTVPVRTPTPFTVVSTVHPDCVTVAASPIEDRPHEFAYELT